MTHLTPHSQSSAPDSIASVAPEIAPVIAIDGPSASGKGTVAQRVADTLGFHYLDSGAIYRIVALAAQQSEISWQNAQALASLVQYLDIRFQHDTIWLNGAEVSAEIRTENISSGASQVAVHPELRKALVRLQQNFLQIPGLVADGRDMATVIFPQADLKIYLTASVEIRAERRYKQLKEKGLHANLADILKDLQERDTRDLQRQSAPLQQAEGAVLLTTDQMTIAQAVDFVLTEYRIRNQ